MNFKAFLGGGGAKVKYASVCKQKQAFYLYGKYAKQFFSSTEKSLRSEIAGFDCRGSHISRL